MSRKRPFSCLGIRGSALILSPQKYRDFGKKQREKNISSARDLERGVI